MQGVYLGDVKVENVTQQRNGSTRPTCLLLEEALLDRTVFESKTVKTEVHQGWEDDNNANQSCMSPYKTGKSSRGRKRKVIAEDGRSAGSKRTCRSRRSVDGYYRHLNDPAQEKPEVKTRKSGGLTKRRNIAKSATLGIKCAVARCNNTCYDGEGHKTPHHFFNIPSDKTSERKWRRFLADAAGRADIEISCGMRVCSDHFDQKKLRKCYNPRTERYNLCSSLHPTIISKSQDREEKQSVRVTSSSRLPREFMCETCEMPFPCYGDYYLHMESHSGLNSGLMGHQRVVQCIVCNQMFPGAGSVIEHMVSHTHQKPYTCPVCGGQFDHVSERRQCSISHAHRRHKKH